MPCPPAARLLLPHPALGGCIFAAVERDTRGSSLAEAERFNYYPATPMAMISWIFEGSLHMLEERSPGDRPTLGPALPRLVFSGPQRRPSASWSPGPVHALSVAFYPEALGRLLGTRIEPLFDRILPADEVFAGALLAACDSLFDPAPDAAPFPRLEAVLAPFWREAGPPGPTPLLGDWIRALAARAAFSQAGAGIRQMQRRIKTWTGQSHRDLQLFSRVEAAFAYARRHRTGASLDLAGLASDAGFADQSHMGREVRRVTGLSPARLDERMAQDEAFWFYRLLDGRHAGR